MLITVRVHPRSSRAKVVRSGDVLEVWVHAAAIDGAANKAVLQAVAAELGVAVSSLQLRSGARGRTKVLEVPASGELRSRSGRSSPEP
ncbi:MAG: DUF167 domain-containing protein [Candidatus Dormibacterales bacterium]